MQKLDLTDKRKRKKFHINPSYLQSVGEHKDGHLVWLCELLVDNNPELMTGQRRIRLEGVLVGDISTYTFQRRCLDEEFYNLRLVSAKGKPSRFVAKFVQLDLDTASSRVGVELQFNSNVPPLVGEDGEVRPECFEPECIAFPHPLTEVHVWGSGEELF